MFVYSLSKSRCKLGVPMKIALSPTNLDKISEL